MVTVGTGKYTYELAEDWAKLPQGQAMGWASMIATDSSDRVYVFQREKEPSVLIFDRSGNYINGWGIGTFAGPHGIYIKDDVVYVTDRDDSIVLLFTLEGRPLKIIGERGNHSDTGVGPDFDDENDVVPKSAGPFHFPSKLIPGPSGNLYVSDGYRNARVHKFTTEGDLAQSWGEPGNGGPFQFQLVHSLLVTDDENIYVSDRENHRIQVFNSEGRFLNMWTNVRRPIDFAIDNEGTFFVSEVFVELDKVGQNPTGTSRVSVRDRNGQVITQWETPASHGIWVDRHGDIYLAQMELGIQKYVKKS